MASSGPLQSLTAIILQWLCGTPITSNQAMPKSIFPCALWSSTSISVAKSFSPTDTKTLRDSSETHRCSVGLWSQTRGKLWWNPATGWPHAPPPLGPSHFLCLCPTVNVPLAACCWWNGSKPTIPTSHLESFSSVPNTIVLKQSFGLRALYTNFRGCPCGIQATPIALYLWQQRSCISAICRPALLPAGDVGHS